MIEINKSKLQEAISIAQKAVSESADETKLSIKNIFMKYFESHFEKVEKEIRRKAVSELFRLFDYRVSSDSLTEHETEYILKDKMIKILRRKSFKNRIANSIFSGAGELSIPIEYILLEDKLSFEELNNYLEEENTPEMIDVLIYKELIKELRKDDFINSNIQFQIKALNKIKQLFLRILKNKGVRVGIGIAGAILTEIIASSISDVIRNLFIKKKKCTYNRGEFSSVFYFLINMEEYI